MIQPGFSFVGALLIGLATLPACSPREFLYGIMVKQQGEYFAPDGYEKKTDFEKLSPRVHTFRWSWYRNIVIQTDEGLVVIDPFNPTAAGALKAELDREFPGVPVAALIYSHYHLDHTRGGAELKPARVIAHVKCPDYWKDVQARDVLAPTEFVSGDRTLRIGGVEIRMLYLGRSHTDTLYAFHLPSERLLFTADFGLVKSFIPLGHPDAYAPGVLRGLERLSKVDFDIFVPSHFGHGKKSDLVDSMEMIRFVRKRAREGLDQFGEGGGMPHKGENLKKLFFHVYDPMKEKYGHWHGFDEQSLNMVIRSAVGESLGY